jgi:oligopeptide/dipeptide ABC transporter ATP-binding protein
MNALLDVAGLSVQLNVEGRMRTVLHDVAFSVAPGEALGLVGESGSGKSMTVRTISRLLPAGAQVAGRMVFDGTPVQGLRRQALRAYRTNAIAMIFQDPRAHINPVRRIGDFLTEAMRTNLGIRAKAANHRAIEVLERVGIDDGERRLRQYPHELSGGLLQRVMIASVLAVPPRLILADEPTTALDVTTQSEVMALLDELRHELGMSMLFITHDLDLAGAVCDRTAVMYAGSIVEEQAAELLHTSPLHPYTSALVQARPDINQKSAQLRSIVGQPLSAFEAPDGCAFAPRCGHAETSCHTSAQSLRTVTGGSSRCMRTDDLRALLAEEVRS